MATGSTKAPIPGLKNVFAVGSGKGGVGKSTVAASIAFGLKLQGASVGLMDADAYGPSIPHMLGVRARPATREIDGKQRLMPVEKDGLKLISMGFFIDDEQPAIWRGPMLDGLVRQFIADVFWGELDYLVVDLPPTTGDVPLSLAQRFPLTGAVIVCTPQDVALLDAVRAMNMFRQLNVPILGIVENMSLFLCPHCGGRSDIFGHGGAKATAEKQGVPFLGEIPINLQIRVNGDLGKLKDSYTEGNPARPHLLNVSEQVAAQIKIQNEQTPALPSL